MAIAPQLELTLVGDVAEKRPYLELTYTASCIDSACPSP